MVKPASATPLGALRLAELFDETELPKGMYQVLPVRSKVADAMARDERYRKISFTGSAAIGWYLKSLDPKKRVTLELGGNAGVIVHSDADLDLAAQRDGVRRLLPGRSVVHQRPAGAGRSETSTTTSQSC